MTQTRHELCVTIILHMLLDTESQHREDERSDEEILTLSIEHPDMFRILVRRYEGPFLGKARKIVHSKENAEDVVQETFTKIYLNARRFTPQEGASFSSWAYRILINTAISYYRKLKRTRAVMAPIPDDVLEYVAEHIDEMEEYVLQDYVASLMTRIPRSFQTVLKKYFLEGKSHKEIAEELHTTEGAIKTQAYRARKAFKEAVDTSE